MIVTESRNIPPINMPPREEKLKIKMLDEFKGEPALVGEWLRRMEAYFTQYLDFQNNFYKVIFIALGNIKGGQGNRAGQWADTMLDKMLECRKEFELRLTLGNASEDWTMKDMINGRDGYPPFVKKPPFKNWEDFKWAVENFFLTEETQHEAIIKIQ